MTPELAASLLSHKNATPEMAERLFLRAHDMINNATDPYNSDGVEDGLSLAEVAAASRVFTKQLFDKYKDNPYMLGYMASSRHR
jgi:hypothetical protein